MNICVQCCYLLVVLLDFFTFVDLAGRGSSYQVVWGGGVGGAMGASVMSGIGVLLRYCGVESA